MKAHNIKKMIQGIGCSIALQAALLQPAPADTLEQIITQETQTENTVAPDKIVRSLREIIEFGREKYTAISTTSPYADEFYGTIFWNDASNSPLTNTNYQIWVIDGIGRTRGVYAIEEREHLGDYGFFPVYDNETEPYEGAPLDKKDTLNVFVQDISSGNMYVGYFLDETNNPTEVTFQGAGDLREKNIMVEPKRIGSTQHIAISNIKRNPTQSLSLSIIGSPGGEFWVEESNCLIDPEWNVLEYSILDDTGNENVYINKNEGSKIYRVRGTLE